MADEVDTAFNARDLFGTVDLDGSGYIDREELAAVCDLDYEDLGEVFNQLDVDRDGRISIEEFSENFKKFKNVVSGLKQKRLTRSATGDEIEELKQRLGKSFSNLSGHEYVTELFHHIHSAGDSPQLLSLLESFLFSVVRDVKNYESENQRLEEALKRTCEKHAEHMENLDEELEHQLSKVEHRIKKEEQSKYERSNMDVIWQMENKNKEIQALQAKVQKLESKIKRKEPEEQKLKEEIDERVQEIRYLRSQVTDAQTNTAVLRSELAQLRNDYEDQTVHLENEKRTVMECVQEQESLTRQLQLLHEANKKLHDTNDDLRSALEARRTSETGRSPSPSKRSSITTLYSPGPKSYKRSKSSINSRSPSSINDADDRLSASLGATPLRSPLHSCASSRRNSLLPVQQSCEEDDPALNEDSLMNEIRGVNRHRSSLPDGTEEEDEAYGTLPSSERESMRMQLNLLAETNKRLCESNNDLRAALETVSKRVSKPRSREKCKRNQSFHSDYGSISSRSITPNHLQGPKSENDIADGAEDLSGYEPESDGNNTSTLTLQGRHEELPERIIKSLATPRERIKIAGRETNDVIWESDHENETADHDELKRHANANENERNTDNPFARNSLLRRPLRHKSIESLAAEMDGNPAGGKGDRSNWPDLARNGKWNSMEQMRKKNEFAGVRSKSLPASRCQSSESLDFQTGAGLTELSEKLNALKTSQENILLETDNPESEDPSFDCDDLNAENDSGLSKSDQDEGRGNEDALEDYPKEGISKHAEDNVQRSPSKSTNTERTELVSSAVQVNMSSGRSTPADPIPKRKRSSSKNEPSKDKKKEKTSPREKKHTSKASNDETKHPEGLTRTSKKGSSRDGSRERPKEYKNRTTNDGLRDGSRERPKEDENRTKSDGLSRDDPRERTREDTKEGSNNCTKSRENLTKVLNHGESPYRSTSARPYSQNTSGSSLPQDILLNKSPYTSPRTTPGHKKESFNRGRTELLSLIAGERPCQDLTTVQNLRIEVEDKSRPNNLDLDRSITYDIFAPLNKSCPIFTTKGRPSDAHQPEHDPGLNTSRGNWTQLRKMSPYGSALVHRVRTESLADTDLSKVEILSAELEAQFKSVKEEDEEDIDEDDVDDEELAQLVAMATGLSESEEETESELDSTDGIRPATIGTSDLSEASTNTPYSHSMTQDIVPERMFKLVLAGDAAVGKSSFILRLCRNRFHNALNSTLGVDFQMKTLVVEGKTIALQLWDTAGQERFRSIAKSYFRKADGVLLLYDVTCETSFLDVRDWVEAIEESCSKPVPIMLCGNKTDLRQQSITEGKMVISAESGQKLAKEYGALFMETSAKDNQNITEACVKLARMLQDLEDIEVNKNKDRGLQLSEADAKAKKKTSCCPR